MNARLLGLAALLLTAAVTPALACSSCGCNLTSDWLSQGLVAQPGTTIGLRYDFVPQTQLRRGSSALDRAAIALPAEREIEGRTENHYVTLSIDHAINAAWALNVQVPFSDRPHQTVAAGDISTSTSRTNGLGDVRVSARYQGFGGAGITGVQFGLKLPTGSFHQTFRSGPGVGQPVDRDLQPGSGTANALVGAYHFGRLSGGFDYVLQAQAEVALAAREEFRPGVAGTLSAGVSYHGWKRATPQLQLNLRLPDRDHGTNADELNSGGQQLYIAPGVSAPITNHLSAFGFVQLPLYQRVRGYQLVPRYTASMGLQYRL